MAERPSGWRHLAEQNRELLTRALEKLAATERDNARLAAELVGARAIATEVQRLLDLSLPSEQTGPEWEKTVRVPLARLEAIDVVLARLGGGAS